MFQDMLQIMYLDAGAGNISIFEVQFGVVPRYSWPVSDLLHPRLSTRELQALQNGVGGLTKKEHMHTITFDFGLDEYKFLQEIKLYQINSNQKIKGGSV